MFARAGKHLALGGRRRMALVATVLSALVAVMAGIAISITSPSSDAAFVSIFPEQVEFNPGFTFDYNGGTDHIFYIEAEGLGAYGTTLYGYCMDGNVAGRTGCEGPCVDGVKFTRQNMLGGADGNIGDAEYGFIAANGFPTTNTIYGVTYSDKAAAYITQIAIWNVYPRWESGDPLNFGTVTDPDTGQNLAAVASQLFTDARNWAKTGNNASDASAGAAQAAYWYKPPADHETMQRVLVIPTPPKGSISVHKSASSTITVTGSMEASYYTFEGAQYGLFADAACTVPVKNVANENTTFTIQANGDSTMVHMVEPGHYYLKETVAPPGYKLDTHVYEVDVPKADLVQAEVADEAITGYVKVVKEDASTGQPVSMAGFEFDLYEQGGTTALAHATTISDGTAIFDVNLAVGNTYEVLETACPSGWELNNQRHPITLIQSGSDGAIQGATEAKETGGPINVTPVKVPDQPSDGDKISLSVRKVWENDTAGDRPSSLTVRLKNGNTVVKRVTLNADNNWEQTVSGLAKYVGGGNSGTEIEYTWDEPTVPSGYVLKSITADGDITLVTNKKTEMTSTTVKKVWNDNNDANGKRPSSIKVTLTKDGQAQKQVTLSSSNSWQHTESNLEKYAEDGTTPITYAWTEPNVPTGYTLEGITKDGDITLVTNTYNPNPSIGTQLATTDGEHDILLGNETITLKDTVSYSELTPNQTYELRGELREKDGSATGKAIEGCTVTKTFKPTSASGTVEVEFTLDLSKVSHDVVAFEELYMGTSLVTDHKDINDDGQTVKVHKPEIGTKLATIDEGDRLDATAGTVTVTDTVEYSGLIPNKEYELSGEIHARKDGQDAGVIEGATATAKFIPEEEAGTTEVEFEVDLSKLDGDAIVAFEELRIGAKLIAEHKDIEDEDQTIEVDRSEMRTKLATADGSKEVMAGLEDGMIELTDTVAYKKLTPGKEYVLKGVLHAKADDGSDAGTVGEAGETKFTPEEADGTIEVKLKVDVNVVKETAVVAFEELYLEEKLIDEHKDINDDDQTVTVKHPSIRTTLMTQDGKKTVRGGQTVTLVDEVEYSELVPGVEYEVYGEIHTRGANNTDGGVLKGATATAKFTPQSPSGKVKVTFSVTLPARSNPTVAFEELRLKKPDGSTRKLAEHKDITDANQTVTVTNASDLASDLLKTGDTVLPSLLVALVAGIGFFAVRRMPEEA